MDIPALSFDTDNPIIGFGQITDIFITEVGNPLADLLQPTLDARVDNAASVGAEMRKLTVIGDKPAPESSETKISHFRTIHGPRQHTINFRVDETDDTNYNFVRGLIANNVRTVLAWYVVHKKKFHGGLEGIECSIKADFVTPESEEELETIVGTLTFTGNYPERTDWPLPVA